MKNGTWEICSLPKGVVPMGLQMGFYCKAQIRWDNGKVLGSIGCKRVYTNLWN